MVPNAAENLPTPEQEHKLKAMRGVVAFTTHRFAIAKKNMTLRAEKGASTGEGNREKILLGLFVILGALYVIFFTNLVMPPEDPVAALPADKQALYDQLVKQAQEAPPPAPKDK